MATYTVTGHPLNQLPTGTANGQAIRDLLQTVGVGASVTIVLSGGEDTMVKAHGALK